MEALYGESARGGVRNALLVLFGLLGLDAVAHGLIKLAQGPANLGGGGIAHLGLPFPTFMGAMIMVVELIGGILLLVGIVWEVTYQVGRSRPP